MNDSEFDYLLFSKDEENELEPLLRHLEKLDSVIVQLLADGTTLIDAHTLFEDMATKYVMLKACSSLSPSSVTNQNFDSAITLLRNGKERFPSHDKERYLRHLKVYEVKDEAPRVHELFFLQK